MKKAFFLFLLSLVACDLELDSIILQKFQKFIKKQNKKYEYSIKEYLARFEVFKTFILNSISNEEQSYKIGITKFSDLTKQEFTKNLFTFKL